MIRKAIITDIKAIQTLVNQFADSGHMLPRSLNELYESLRDFIVYEDQGTIIAVCALHVSWDGLAELRSLAVARNSMKQGIGTALVRHCLEEASELHIDRVFVLTYEARFFRKLGFIDIDKKELPHKIWNDCLNCVKFPDCDESALIISIS